MKNLKLIYSNEIQINTFGQIRLSYKFFYFLNHKYYRFLYHL